MTDQRTKAELEQQLSETEDKLTRARTNEGALSTIDYDRLTERQLAELETGAKAQRGSRAATRHLSMVEGIAGMMPPATATVDPSTPEQNAAGRSS